MKRIIVLIASHINDIDRFSDLERAIDSVNNNTKKPDAIYLSLSLSSSLSSNNNTNFISSLPNKNVILFLHTERKMQFQHLHFLTKFVNDDDIVCFLDDDDYYHNKKLEIVYNNFNTSDKDFILCHRHITVGERDPNTHNYWIEKNLIEFWRLNMYGSLYKDWFVNTHKYVGNSTTFQEVIDKFQGWTDAIFSSSLYKKFNFIEDELIYHTLKNNHNTSRSYHIKEPKISFYKICNDIIEKQADGIIINTSESDDDSYDDCKELLSGLFPGIYD